MVRIMKQVLERHRFFLLVFFLILFNIALSVQLHFLKQKEKSQVVEVVGFQDSISEKKIVEEEHPYQLRVYYPITSYPTLNQKIDSMIQGHIRDFKKEISSIDVQLDQVYSLDILYQEYEYRSYISYVFTIFQDTGGAHPYSFYSSVIYDKDTNEIITIDYLIEKDASFLKTVSKNVREKLSKNPAIVSYDMMIQGTSPEKENFSHFAITENGYLFFFSPYQVAPYSSGKFQVLLPYKLFEEESRDKETGALRGGA